jgi:penicillin amidase
MKQTFVYRFLIDEKSGSMKVWIVAGVSQTLIILLVCVLLIGLGFPPSGFVNVLPRLFLTCFYSAIWAVVVPIIIYLLALVLYTIIETTLDKLKDNAGTYETEGEYEQLVEEYEEMKPSKKRRTIIRTQKSIRVICLGFQLLIISWLLFLAIVYSLAQRRTVPDRNATVAAAGLRALVSVKHEREGNVIIIQGETDHDVLLAQGFITARERLWQLEFQKRLGRGTLSEIIGSDALQVDKFARTMGFLKAATSAFDALAEDTKADIKAFAQGVNAYIVAPQAMAPEFNVWNTAPTTFDPVDVVLAYKLYYWSQSSNMGLELDRYLMLLSNTTLQRAMEILPPYPDTFTNPNATTILKSLEELGLPPVSMDEALKMEADRKDSSGSYIPERTASVQLPKDRLLESTFLAPPITGNHFVYTNNTANGKPILAADIQLTLTAPSSFIIMRLQSPKYNSFGTVLVGTPGIMIGRNDEFAFSLNNAMADQQDLYVLEPSGDKYIYNGVPTSYTTRIETINILGQPAQNITVRQSVWGPVINDLFPHFEKPTSLRWTGLVNGDTSADTFCCHWKAINTQQFTNCFKTFFGPVSTILYTEASGLTNFLVAGKIPKRKYGHSGMFPVYGNSSAYEYDGYVEWKDLVRVTNQDYLIASNNRVTPMGMNYSTSIDGEIYFRANRIEQLLQGTVTFDRVKDVLLNTQSGYFLSMKPYLEQMTTTNPQLKETLALLKSWDGIEKDSRATIFEYWIDQMARLVAPEIGQERLYHSSHIFYILEILKKNSDLACSRLGVSTCTEAALIALQRAMNKLNNPAQDWSSMHITEIHHLGMENTRLQCMTCLSLPSITGTQTINEGSGKMNGKMYSTSGSSFRMIIDTSGEQVFMHSMGQDGNFLANEYEQVLAWNNGDFFKMNMDVAAYRYQQTLEPVPK